MDTQEKIINILKNQDKVKIKVSDHGLILKLSSKKIINYKQITENIYSLTTDGYDIIQNGSPEYNYMKGDLKIEKSVGFNNAMKKGWIKLENGLVKKIVADIKDELKENLLKIKNCEGFDMKIVSNDILKELLRRKLIEKKKVIYYEISKGENFLKEDKNLETDILCEMIGKSFNLKDYNWNTLGILPLNGALHPLNKIKDEFRNIFLEMGFEEMNTRKYVESSFWNFDSLFQPQNHPSREAHDTFFIKNPKYSTFPEEYGKKVKKIHEDGDFGSLGYGYGWSEEEASKNILRTHTTAISAQYLYNLKKLEIKLFSIDRVFRNEHVDATHLAEFHQVEGLIAGKNLNLKHLLGILSQFFKKLGIEKLKFKPAYNPYTEPSVEVFAFHPKLKKYIEIGNSGIFRPEMIKPMGLDCSVIAWGLSLERPAMIKYGIKNIRQLFGHGVDFDYIRKNNICYF